MTIRINERSLATAVLVRCLQAKGADFTLVGPAKRPPSGPSHICINDVAISLLRDFFPAVWTWDGAACQVLTMREVVWGDDPKPRRIRQEARVVDAGALTRLLFAALDEKEMTADAKPAGPARWQVNSEAGASRLLRTGDRAMLTARVGLVRPLDPPRSLVESLLDGWMFLAPIDDESAILQAMIPKPAADTSHRLQSMLDQSSLIARHVATVGHVAQFAAAPAIRVPLAGHDGRIFVGRHGARLDPVSGEGAPFAIRTAILAAAALTHDGPEEEAIEFYRLRIQTSFLSHLAGCQSFYSDAFSTDADWRTELRKSGITRSMLEPVPGASTDAAPSLRLNGLTLAASTPSVPSGQL